MDEPWTVRPDKIVKPVLSKLPFRVNEAINILRGNIQMSGYRLKAIAVTSAGAHEGKSSTAFRLAKSMAALDKRVLYLDCDIRNSKKQKRYQIEGEYKGLSEYLCGKSVHWGSVLQHLQTPYPSICHLCGKQFPQAGFSHKGIH